jgi:glutaredoxin
MRVVMVTSPTCIKCKNLKPILGEFLEEKGIKFDVLDAMSGSEEVSHLIEQYNIKSVPFIIIYNDANEEIFANAGDITLPEIEKVIKEAQ